MAVELSQAANDGNTETYFDLISVVDATDSLNFSKDNTTLFARYYVNGSPTTAASATYNATNHRWLRFRELSGTAYWEVSANGTTWNAFASWVISGIDVTAVNIEIAAGTYDVQAAPGTAKFDDVRIKGINKVLTPATGSLVAAGVQPTVNESFFTTPITPLVAALTIQGKSPNLGTITPSVGALTIAGTQPILDVTITPSAGSLTATGVLGEPVEQTNYVSTPQGTIS